MATAQSKIIYTLTDEAPLLATHAFLPIISTFTAAGGHRHRGERHLGGGPDPGQIPRVPDAASRSVPDTLAELGKQTLEPDTNIIKLPNISASVQPADGRDQGTAGKGYKIPDYPEDPKTDEEKAHPARYAKCIGSAVNPVLREGNSDRRAPRAVKEYARKNPHSMAEWSPASRTHVSHMTRRRLLPRRKVDDAGPSARDVKMELVTKSGQTIVLKPKVSLLAGEIIDCMFMSKKALLRVLRSSRSKTRARPA